MNTFTEIKISYAIKQEVIEELDNTNINEMISVITTLEVI